LYPVISHNTTTRFALLGKLGCFFLLVSFWGCRTEEEYSALNQAPKTVISIDNIKQSGSNRLITQLTLHWNATDADGTVIGYRLGWGQDTSTAIAQLNASPLIQKTDSTFLFNFEQQNGQGDSADIVFCVQAIDNKLLGDPAPPILTIPVKNSRPQISFLDDGMSLADTIWSVLSFPYTFSDPDGEGNIDSILIRINDGPWVNLPKNVRFLSLVPEDPGALNATNSLAFAGENLATQTQEPQPISNVSIPGLVLNDFNRIYLRIKDLAGSESMDTAGKAYYVRRKTSDFLMVDAFKEALPLGDTAYYNLMSGISTYDKLDLLYQKGAEGYVNQPKFWNATYYLLARLYKKHFWFSNIFNTTVGEVPMLLSYAAPSYNQYLRFNGKLLISTILPPPPSQLLPDDPIFSLVPIDSVTRQVGSARLLARAPIIPEVAGFDTLWNRPSQKPGIDIFYPKPGIEILYTIPRTSLSQVFTAPGKAIAIRTKNPFNNRSNLIFFGMEITQLTGNRTNLNNTISKILNDEFNW